MAQLVVRKADNVIANNVASNGYVQPYPAGSDPEDIDSQDMILEKEDIVDLVEGHADYKMVLHEFGHVMGLDDVDTVASGYTIDTTAMSYTDGKYATSSRLPATPMIYDIAAAQYLYGANRSVTTDTTYNQAQGLIDGSNKAVTIWDAGGVDTIDAQWLQSGQNALIDLRGGLDENGKVRFSIVNTQN